MARVNRVVEHLLNDRPDLEATKGYFFEWWPSINWLGHINTFALYNYLFNIEKKEELFAFYLLGAVRVFGWAVDYDCNSAEEAWQAVQFLVEDLLPETAEVKEPFIKVKYKVRSARPSQ